MEKKMVKKLLALLMIITIVTTDFCVLGSSLITYAANQIESATTNSNIEFSVYFKDEDGEKVSSIEKSIKSKNLKLYAEINVKSDDGYLEDGSTFKILNSNFNVISSSKGNLKDNTITLNQINAGEAIKMEMEIEPIILDEIEPDFLSKTSTVELNGKYIYSQAENGENINETRDISVKYNPESTITAELQTQLITNKVFLMGEENKRIVQLLIKSTIAENQYPIETTTLNISIPKIGEEVPEVSVLSLGEFATSGNVGASHYVSDGKDITITLNNEVQNGKINWNKDVYDEIVVTFIYEDDVDVSNAEISVNSEIKLYNNEKIYKETKTNIIGENELNQIVIGQTEITTKDLYKGQLYANITSTTKTDITYETKTIVGITNSKVSNQIIIHEGKDIFGTDKAELTIDTHYISTQINKEKFLQLFGENATLVIKNGQTELETIEVDDNIVVNYPTNNDINDIYIIITGQPKSTGILEINHVKTINGKKYDRKDLKNVTTLIAKNTTSAVLNDEKIVENSTNTSIELKETISRAELTIIENAKKLAVGETNELKLGVEFITDGIQYDLYSNPVIYIQLPSVVEQVTIGSITPLYNDNNEIVEIHSNVKENNVGKYLEIVVEGEQKSYPETQLYLQIELSNIVLNKLTTTHADVITMKYTNENATQYYNDGCDTQIIEISGPGELITDFNLTTNQNISKKQVQSGEKIQFEAILINDTDSDMNDVKILGKLPTDKITIEGNEENTLSTNLQEIIAPNATIYYTEKANATTDTFDETNGWTNVLSEAPNAKLYLIEIGTLNKGDNYNAKIKVKVANEIENDLEAYTNYSVICGTETVKTSKTIGLVTYKVSDVEIDLTAQVGKDKLTSGDIVKEGEVIKYTVTVTNNTGERLENVKVVGDVPDGTVLVEPKEDYEYYMYYYEEKTGETQVSNICSVLEPEVPYIMEYEVRVKTDITSTGIKEVSNKVTAICNNVESQSKEIKNTIEESKIRVSIEKALISTSTIFAGSEMEYFVYIENISDKTVKNLEMEIISDMFEVTAIKSDSINYKEGDEIPDKIVIDKIAENSTLQFKISGIIRSDAENILQTMVTITNSEGVCRSNLFSDILPNVNATIDLSSDRENNTYVEYGDSINYKITAKNTGDITELITIEDNISDYLSIESINVNGKVYVQKVDQTSEGYNAIISNYIFIKQTLEPGETIQIDVKATVAYMPDEAEDKIITNIAQVKTNGVIKGTTEEIRYILTFDIDAKDDGEILDPSEPTDPIVPSTPTNPGDPTDKKEKNTLTGIAWLDEDEDGQRDSNETLLSGIKVRIYDILTKNYLTDDNGKIVETTTGKDGSYMINNIEKGSYIILFEYDIEKYELTTYFAPNVDETKNSKVVLKTIEVNGEKITLAVTDTINVQEDINYINIGLKEKSKFDLELNKYISRIVVQTSKDIKTYDYENTTFAKAEIYRKNIDGALVVLEYTIQIKNNGDIAGYAKNIVDYLPNGLTFSSELNTDWYLSGSYLYTKKFENVEIQPGETAEIKLILTKNMTNDNLGLINNRAEIYQDYNQYGKIDIDSTPNNQVQDEDDFGAVNVIIQVATGGSTIAYIILLITNIILIGIAIKLMIRNQIIKIPNFKERR